MSYIIPDSRMEMPELLTLGRKPTGNVVFNHDNRLAKKTKRYFLLKDTNVIRDMVTGVTHSPLATYSSGATPYAGGLLHSRDTGSSSYNIGDLDEMCGLSSPNYTIAFIMDKYSGSANPVSGNFIGLPPTIATYVIGVIGDETEDISAKAPYNQTATYTNVPAPVGVEHYAIGFHHSWPEAINRISANLNYSANNDPSADDSGGDILINNNPIAGTQIQGTHHLYTVFSPMLTEAEWESFVLDPYQLVMPP